MPAPSRPALGSVRFGVFEADLQTAELRKNSARIKLEGQRFQILALLLARPGQLVTREELKRELWPADTFVDFEHSINEAVKRLRQALDDSADSPRFIETLPRRGYRFIYPINGAAAPSTAAEAPQTITGWRRPWAIGGLALVVGGVAFGAVLATNVGGLRNRLFGRPAAGEITSIAVLPLENLMGDPEQEYLVDAIHDDLITELAQIGSLKVISRTSVMRYKQEKPKPLANIARELGVDAVLEGAVKSAGDRKRITVQLIYVPTDSHLWARSYDRDERGVQALPDEVARAIAGRLNIKLTPLEQALLASSQAVDPSVYKAYLKGRYYAHKGTEEDVYKGIEHLREAIDLDPTYAPAWQRLAAAYSVLGLRSHLPPREAYSKAMAAALKAVEIDDRLFPAHQVLGQVKFLYQWDWQGAEQEFQRARELDPSWPGPSLYFGVTGRFDEGIAATKRALERDPLSPGASQRLGWAYFMAGRYDDSIAQLRKTLELDPDHQYARTQLAWNYAKKGMHTEAVAECEKAIKLLGERHDQEILGSCGWVYAVAGRKAEALKLVRQLERLAAHRWLDPVYFAYVYDGLGDTDRALQFLFQSYEERSPRMVHLKVLPLLSDRLRTDARFQELVRRVGIP